MESLKTLQIILKSTPSDRQPFENLILSGDETEQIKSLVLALRPLSSRSALKCITAYLDELYVWTIGALIAAEQPGILFESDDITYQYAGNDERGNPQFRSIMSSDHRLVSLDLSKPCRCIF